VWRQSSTIINALHWHEDHALAAMQISGLSGQLAHCLQPQRVQDMDERSSHIVETQHIPRAVAVYPARN